MTTSPPADPRPIARRVLAWIGPPLVVALIVRAVFCVAAIDARRSPLIINNWFHWDANLYLQIATQGMQFSPHPGKSPTDPHPWDGTACWLPGYPLVIRAVIHCGLPPKIAALSVAGIEQVLLLGLIWQMIRRSDDPHPWLTLLIAGFFPAAIYMQAPFPMAQAAIFILLQLLLLKNRRPILAGLAGAAAAFSHPSAVFVVAAPLLALLFPRPLPVRENDSPFRQRAELIIAAGLSLAGFALVLLYDQIAVGAWDAFFKSQHDYGPRAITPMQTLYEAFFGTQGSRRFRAPAFQMFFLTAVVAQCVYSAIRRRFSAPYDRLLVPSTAVAWVAPMSILMLSPYRSHALLTIAAPLLVDVPKRARWLILLGSAYISYELAVSYFKGDLF